MKDNLKFKKIILIVIDSFGIGQAKDAALYNDEGADTFGHIFEQFPNIKLPTLYDLGLGELHPSVNYKQKMGYSLKLNESSYSKDTLTGHWEMMGIKTTVSLKTFTDTGFPVDLIRELESLTNHVFIGNKNASGTSIIQELGEEEIRSKGKKLIIYTSEDSVMQICGHELVTGLDELYRCCKIARQLTMREEYKVGRVIARPYIGNDKNTFERTANRRDFTIKPPQETVLDILKLNGYDVWSIGKINDIFCGNGISRETHSKTSFEGMLQTIEQAKEDFIGLLFVNLVDFDSKWGHRRDVRGYANELEKFDSLLQVLLNTISNDTLVIVTADHGNDPTFKGYNHTRECVPCLMFSKTMKEYGVLEEADSFSVIGMTILDNFNLKKKSYMEGESLLDKMTFF